MRSGLIIQIAIRFTESLTVYCRTAKRYIKVTFDALLARTELTKRAKRSEGIRAVARISVRNRTRKFEGYARAAREWKEENPTLMIPRREPAHVHTGNTIA